MRKDLELIKKRLQWCVSNNPTPYDQITRILNNTKLTDFMNSDIEQITEKLLNPEQPQGLKDICLTARLLSKKIIANRENKPKLKELIACIKSVITALDHILSKDLDAQTIQEQGRICRQIGTSLQTLSTAPTPAAAALASNPSRPQTVHYGMIEHYFQIVAFTEFSNAPLPAAPAARLQGYNMTWARATEGPKAIIKSVGDFLQRKTDAIYVIVTSPKHKQQAEEFQSKILEMNKGTNYETHALICEISIDYLMLKLTDEEKSKIRINWGCLVQATLPDHRQHTISLRLAGLKDPIRVWSAPAKLTEELRKRAAAAPSPTAPAAAAAPAAPPTALFKDPASPQHPKKQWELVRGEEGKWELVEPRPRPGSPS